MKARWILLAICGGGAIGLLALGILGHVLLGWMGYTWRPWVITVGFLVIPPLLIAALLVGVSIVITKASENKQQGKLSPAMYWMGNSVLLCVGLCLSWGMLKIGLLGLVFSHSPEYVVERDGQKMLAVVNSFLDVNVDYHMYKNAFFMGKDLCISEYYGSGGYDPFEEDPMPTPKEVHDYRK